MVARTKIGGGTSETLSTVESIGRYLPECVEGKFCELRRDAVLRRSCVRHSRKIAWTAKMGHPVVLVILTSRYVTRRGRCSWQEDGRSIYRRCLGPWWLR